MLMSLGMDLVTMVLFVGRETILHHLSDRNCALMVLAVPPLWHSHKTLCNPCCSYGTTQGSLTTPKFPTTPLLHPTTSGPFATTTGEPPSCLMTQPWFPKLTTPPAWQAPILAFKPGFPVLMTVRAGYPPLRELNPPFLQLTPPAWQYTSGTHCFATELMTLLGWIPALRELNPPFWELWRPDRLPREP